MDLPNETPEEVSGEAGVSREFHWRARTVPHRPLLCRPQSLQKAIPMKNEPHSALGEPPGLLQWVLGSSTGVEVGSEPGVGGLDQEQTEDSVTPCYRTGPLGSQAIEVDRRSNGRFGQGFTGAYAHTQRRQHKRKHPQADAPWRSRESFFKKLERGKGDTCRCRGGCISTCPLKGPASACATRLIGN